MSHETGTNMSRETGMNMSHETGTNMSRETGECARVEGPSADGSPVDAFLGVDWGEAWERLHPQQGDPDDHSFWDMRARNFKVQPGGAARPVMTSYMKRFLEFADVRPGESVLDMGCAAGALTLPLAHEGHHIVAADFSPVMLDAYRETASAEGIDNIEFHLASWTDDWEARGIPMVDIAFASRSIAAHDLKGCLRKLDAHARRRVCITISGSEAPAMDTVLLDAIGRDHGRNLDVIYCENILAQMDIMPEVRFIDTLKCDTYPTREAFAEATRKELGGVAPQEEQAFRDYLETYAVDKGENGEHAWTRSYPLPIRWAFLSWDKTAFESRA